MPVNKQNQKTITMRKNYFFFALPIAALFVAAPAFTNSSAGPSGRTGSPGDNNVTCAAGCHTGSMPTDQSTTIDASSIPASGYVPGASYDILVTADRGTFNGNKVGFSLTAENTATNAKIGGFMANTEVQVNGTASSHATHRSSSNTGTGTTKTWTVQWTAPAAGTGDVSFYAIAVLANGNGANSGDKVAQATPVTISEDVTIGLADNELKVKFYPQPARDYVRLAFEQNTEWLQVRMLNSAGQFVQQLWYSSTQGEQDIRIELSDVAKGTYWVEFATEKGQIVKPLLVQ